MHIPFFARGPNILPGTIVTEMGSNIDIAPTFLDIAGLPPSPEHDGRSLMPLLTKNNVAKHHVAKNDHALDKPWRDHLLIEYFSVGTYYNDHAVLWESGPGKETGTPTTYGKGPMANNPTLTKEQCEQSELKTLGEVGQGSCWFVDSQTSNNWIALRIRNDTHNVLYVESFGLNSLTHPTYDAGKKGVGVYSCLDGDQCNLEYYDYGPITSDYGKYPIMTRERWNIDNLYLNQSVQMKGVLHEMLKEQYCTTKRLEVDRMGCT